MSLKVVEGLLWVGAQAALALVVIWATVHGAVLVASLWRKLSAKAGATYDAYAAEQAIRAIRRRAIHELLTAEREHGYLGSNDDVIEGTAVEVER
jgi:hypothetical protein